VRTYWNGEPCRAERVTVIVGKPLRSTWWCAPLEGKEHPAIKITQGDESFYIADDERGWQKITEGKGSFMYSHSSLPVEREVTPTASGKMEGK
jgi:hypothetical protein